MAEDVRTGKKCELEPRTWHKTHLTSHSCKPFTHHPEGRGPFSVCLALDFLGLMLGPSYVQCLLNPIFHETLEDPELRCVSFFYRFQMAQVAHKGQVPKQRGSRAQCSLGVVEKESMQAYLPAPWSFWDWHSHHLRHRETRARACDVQANFRPRVDASNPQESAICGHARMAQHTGWGGEANERNGETGSVGWSKLGGPLRCVPTWDPT